MMIIRKSAGVLKRRRFVSAAAVGVVSAAGLVGVAAPQAFAGGVAAISPKSGGDSGTSSNFMLTLPAGAKCSGDTATDHYLVDSYVVPTSVNPLTLKFNSSGAATGAALLSATGAYENQATGVTTGVILSTPTFTWNPYVGDFGTGDDLYAGVWFVGIACVAPGFVLDVPGNGVKGQNGGYNLWNYEVKFTATGTPGNFSWAATLLGVATTSLPPGDINKPYKGVTLTASGGRGPFTWTATGLPSGMSINKTTGAITGTPGGTTGVKTVTITVTDSLHAVTTVTRTLPIQSDPSITTTSLPAGKHGSSYTTTVKASGGSTPYSWSATGLPSGLSIASTTGVISGTPKSAGTYSVKVTMTDKAAVVTTKTYSLKVN